MSRYNPKEIESRWQKKWQTDKTLVPDLQNAKKPFYNLMMFPYPSGEGLHVGHVYAFGGADTFGHFKKMQGWDVFEPMGFDSFGIHSENYAIKIGKHPKDLIEQTTKYFKEEQLQKLGTLFDWDHAVTTSDPDYYRWTQWLFVQLFKSGLAVRKKAPVEWCPSCKTVLANEQVINGHCERCNSEVEQKELEQWFFKITEYAQRLLNNLEKIDWSETTKTMQRNWIGRSTGCEIDFPIKNSKESLRVFTTRPDTIFGATFMVVAPEHPLVKNLDSKEIKDYVEEAKSKSAVDREKEKSGIFSGIYVLNPLTKKEIPVWIADYVLMGYGTGAIMAVPAHDQRDWELAKKYDLPIIEVISGGEVKERAWDGEGKLLNSGKFNGQSVEEAKENISKHIEEKQHGSTKVNFHLRDWLISRQRYWGPPIPMIYCENCAKAGKSWFSTAEAEERSRDLRSKIKEKPGLEYKNLTSDILHLKSEMPGWYPVAEEDLPVELPEINDYQPKGTGVSPLESVPGFLSVNCPECGQKAKRETDVSDTFLDSSWYFLRYLSVGAETSKIRLGGKEIELPWSTDLNQKWLPVDSYIGGNEHAVLHLLYTRFVTMALHDMGLIAFEEPFKKFRAHGLIIYQGAKMSKSRGNVVNPNEYMEAYGVDALRIYLLFIGPYEIGGEFNDRAITGVNRFLNRIHTLISEFKEGNSKPSNNLLLKLNSLNEKVAGDLENLRFNTAIAALMEYLNELYKERSNLSREILKTYLFLLAPLAPFLSEELWEVLGQEGSVHNQTWPEMITVEKQEENIAIVIQVNGVFRDKIEVKKGSSEEQVVELSLKSVKIKNYTEGKKVEKTIWVPEKLLNFVVK